MFFDGVLPDISMWRCPPQGSVPSCAKRCMERKSVAQLRAARRKFRRFSRKLRRWSRASVTPDTDGNRKLHPTHPTHGEMMWDDVMKWWECCVCIYIYILIDWLWWYIYRYTYIDLWMSGRNIRFRRCPGIYHRFSCSHWHGVFFQWRWSQFLV